MTTADLRPRPPVQRPPRPPRRPASWHLRANVVVLAWLALTVAAALARGALPAPRWLLIHLFLLGAVTNAVVTWSEHFANTLLRLPSPPRWWPPARLGALNAGAAAVLGGTVGGLPPLAVAGAAVVVLVVAWHCGRLTVGARRALGGRFSHVRDWYVCAGAALVVGGTLGGLMVSERAPQAWHPRLEAAHLHANLFGWVGLTVLGTLFTLWPTVLRTRIDEGTGPLARRSLRLAAPGLALAVGGLLGGARWIAAAGLLLYAAAALTALTPFLRTARRRRPHTAASWTLAAGTAWFVVALAAASVVVATRPVDEVAGALEPTVPLVAAGFAGHVLVGSLIFLLPVVLGGGPAALKRNAALLERGWALRLAGTTVAVPLTALPVPAWAVHAAWALVLAALGSFVAVAAFAVARSRGLRLSPPAAGALTGALLTALAVAVAVSGDPAPATRSVAGGGVQTVDVTLSGMRIRPSVIEAAPGTRLVLRVTNADAQRHDLRLATGERTPLLRAGQTATLRLPPLTGSIEGWCTVAGHRAAGMTMTIKVAGTDPATGRAVHSEAHSGAASPAPLDLAAPPLPGTGPADAALEPAPGGAEHRLQIRATEAELQVAPGVRQRMWTFGGTVPGPVLRGKVGDVFTITFVNDAAMGHGIDVHAGSLAPDRPMRTIQPGERLTYRFKAERAGAWLYHCSTAPMMQHIANGMYGAVIIDPPDLPRADREYLLVQGELYLGRPGEAGQVAKMREGRPDAWMFNGMAAGYDHAPLTARVGERVRIWVVAAGPSSGTSFHIVGAQFDTVYKEGAYLLRRGDPGGAQALDLAAAQGGFVETVFPEAGRYPFVDHDMRHGEAGAHGFFEVRR
ncbi:multicopper oxidase domain-containing protein [Thermomonospora catenispora]|uniref:multicopper oxidase domain-containing protein n=1 Tax=Thermomonospora catenispora TaxID=2493090 RepID=UPI001120578A|nr:multicopper oxidase domain-containing protein [Thermomonospora catenispora]TNY36290.1 nitrite reductase [Thermomonospora catenispora]